MKKRTLRHLDDEIRSMSKKGEFKGTEDQIQDIKDYIEKIERYNASVRYKVKKLKKEQVSKGTPGERVREIDKMLKDESQYKVVSLKGYYNHLNTLEGKDFYHIVDNGFKNYKVKHSTFMKDENPAETHLNIMLKDIKDTKVRVKKKLEGKLSKRDRSRYKNSLKGLNKLEVIAEENLKRLSDKSYKDLEKFDKGDQRYAFLILVVGENIVINA